MRPKSWTYSHAVKFGPDCGSGLELMSPQCGNLYLHQGRVTVFDRAEDAELTAVTTVARARGDASFAVGSRRQSIYAAAWPRHRLRL